MVTASSASEHRQSSTSLCSHEQLDERHAGEALSAMLTTWTDGSDGHYDGGLEVLQSVAEREPVGLRPRKLYHDTRRGGAQRRHARDDVHSPMREQEVVP